VSWADYFLRTAHARMLAERGEASQYAETGQHVLARTRKAGAPDFVTKREHGAATLAEDGLTDDDLLGLQDLNDDAGRVGG